MQIKCKVIGRKEIIKIRAEIKDSESKRNNTKINKNKSCFFELINKMEKSLTGLIKKKNQEGTNKYNQKWKEVTSDTKEILRILKK